jgi:cytochrome P450
MPPILDGSLVSAPPEGSPRHLEGFLDDSVGCLQRLHKLHGSIVGFRKGDSFSLFAFGPDFNRQVLANPDAFYLSSGFPGPKKSAQRHFGAGLFGLNGARHQEQRRLLMPPFRKEAVDSYHEFFVSLTRQFLADWQPGQTRDIAHEMKEYALAITSKLLFGLDDLTTARAIEPVFDEWMELNHETFFSAILPIDARAGRYERLLEVAENLEAHLKELVREGSALKTDRQDVLSILLEAQAAGSLQPIEVVGHMHTLFNAAYHTTTAALTWTLFLLAQHPAVMLDLLDEFTGALAGEAPTPSQLAGLTLLDRVIKESLRVLPPVVYAPRMSMKPVALGPFNLPQGTLVVTSHYVTHHMPELFPEPECFRPDRWLQAAPSPYAYLPFGAGPRMCLGAPFATLMLKVALPMILQRFRLTVVPGARIDRRSTLTLGPRFGIPMLIENQDRRFTASPVAGDIHEMVELPYPARQLAA